MFPKTCTHRVTATADFTVRVWFTDTVPDAAVSDRVQDAAGVTLAPGPPAGERVSWRSGGPPLRLRPHAGDAAVVQLDQLQPLRSGDAAVVQLDQLQSLKPGDAAVVQLDQLQPLKPGDAAVVQLDQLQSLRSGDAAVVQLDQLQPLKPGDAAVVQLDQLQSLRSGDAAVVQLDQLQSLKPGDAAVVQLDQLQPLKPGDAAVVQLDQLQPLRPGDGKRERRREACGRETVSDKDMSMFVDKPPAAVILSEMSRSLLGLVGTRLSRPGPDETVITGC